MRSPELAVDRYSNNADHSSSPSSTADAISRRILIRPRDSNGNISAVLSVVQIQKSAIEHRTMASCCTWFRTMVASNSFKKVLPSCTRSTVCVLCDTIRSRRCTRCSHCRTDAPTRDIMVGDVFQDRRQPGHQEGCCARLLASLSSLRCGYDFLSFEPFWADFKSKLLTCEFFYVNYQGFCPQGPFWIDFKSKLLTF